MRGGGRVSDKSGDWQVIEHVRDRLPDRNGPELPHALCMEAIDLRLYPSLHIIITDEAEREGGPVVRDTPGRSVIIILMIRSVHGERANFTRLILGCIEADFCNQYLLETSRRDLYNTLLCTAIQYHSFCQKLA